MGKKYTWDSEKGCLVPYEVERPREVEAPAAHQDSMEPMQSMADCKIYDSKSAYRRSLKEQGFIEVGTNTEGLEVKSNPFETKEYMEQLKADMSKAYYECRDKMAPMTEYEREKCKRIDKNNKRASYDRRDRDRDGRARS